VRAAGVTPIKLHGTRHTFATLSLATGTPLHVVSKRLGHTTIDMTHRTSSHGLLDTDQAGADAFSAYVWAAAAEPVTNPCPSAAPRRPGTNVPGLWPTCFRMSEAD